MISTLAALAMAAAPAAQPAGASNLAALQGMYEQSCQVKAYGSYDDICNGLRKQLREAEKQAKREKNQAKTAPPPAAVAEAGPAPAGSTPAAPKN